MQKFVYRIKILKCLWIVEKILLTFSLVLECFQISVSLSLKLTYFVCILLITFWSNFLKGNFEQIEVFSQINKMKETKCYDREYGHIIPLSYCMKCETLIGLLKSVITKSYMLVNPSVLLVLLICTWCYCY